MRITHSLAALCTAALLLAGCSGDPAGVRGSVRGGWQGTQNEGGGTDEVTIHHKLGFGDSTFVWTRLHFATGVGPAITPVPVLSQFGRYRVRNGFLEIRVDSIMASRSPAHAEYVRTAVQDPQWVDEYYRIRVDDDRLTIRYRPAPADLPLAEQVLVFEREQSID